MTAPLQKQAFVGWTRFRHGDFQCTVVTDGPINMGPPANGFPKADPREITELLAGAFLPTDSMTLNQNLLIVNTGKNLVLFDTGCGVNHAFGKSSFGPEIGRAIPNMRAAGIQPEEIDLVASLDSKRIYSESEKAVVEACREKLRPSAAVHRQGGCRLGRR